MSSLDDRCMDLGDKYNYLLNNSIAYIMSKKHQVVEKEIKLVFVPSSRLREGLIKVGAEDQLQKFSAKLTDLTKWFKEYEVNSIELYIEGIVKTGPLTELFISAEGKGGCKIILKPKSGK